MKGQTKYICEHAGCGKEYSTKFALRRHVHTHSGIKAWGCELCGKRFSLEQYLSEHMYVHTKAKPFVCNINGCTESFWQRGKLCLHRMTHKEYKKKSYRVFARKNRASNAVAKTPTTSPDSTLSTPPSPKLSSVQLSPQVIDWNQYCLSDFQP